MEQKREKEGGRERESTSDLLVHSLNAHSSYGCAGPKLGAGNSIPISSTADKGPGTCVTTCSSQSVH